MRQVPRVSVVPLKFRVGQSVQVELKYSSGNDGEVRDFLVGNLNNARRSTSGINEVNYRWTFWFRWFSYFYCHRKDSWYHYTFRKQCKHYAGCSKYSISNWCVKNNYSNSKANYSNYTHNPNPNNTYNSNYTNDSNTTSRGGHEISEL